MVKPPRPKRLAVSPPHREQPPAGSPTVTGLPTRIGENDLLLLRGSATSLLHASGSEVHEYRLHREGGTIEAERCATIAFGGRVTALAESRYGVIVATSGGMKSDLHRIVEGRAHHVTALDGTIGSLACTGTSVFAAISLSDRLDGKLVEVDLYRRAISSERPLSHARVELNTDPTGSHLGVVDRKYGTFQVRDTREDPCPPAPTGTQAGVPRSNPSDHPAGCGCTHCCGCRKADSSASPAAHSGPSPSQKGAPCRSAEGGIPTSDGGAVVGKGGRLGSHPGEGPPNPCVADLMWSAARIAHAASAYVAADARGRNFAIVSSTDMRILDHRQLGRAGGIMLADPASAMVLLHDRSTRRWDAIHIDRLIDEIVGLGHVPFFPVLDSVRFQGLQTLSLIGGHASPTGTVKVLILPIVEAGQSFNNPDLPKFADYLARTAFPHVRDYYLENSFGKLHDIQYSMYGVDTGPSGGPLSLPRLVKDYYFPPYDPARVELTKTAVTFPYSLTFDGRESLKLHVQPTAGRGTSKDLALHFPALLLARKHNLFPAQVHFAGTETANVQITRRNPITGTDTTTTLNLKFAAKTVDINSEADIPAAFADLGAYLDAAMAAAETAAGVTPRLFGPPKLRRVKQPDGSFGYLVISFDHAVLTGKRLEITAVSGIPAADPLGFQGALFGHFTLDGSANADALLRSYIDWAATLAQEDAGLDYTQRYLADDPIVTSDLTKKTLLVALTVSIDDGGPGAAVTLTDSAQLGDLFDTATAVPNSDTTFSNRDAPRDLQQLINDAFTAAVSRQSVAPAPPNKRAQSEIDAVNAYFAQFNMIAIGQIGVAVIEPANPDAVRPSEMWTTSAPVRPNALRAVDWFQTGHFKDDDRIQYQVMWNFLFFDSPPDYSVMCHELGHAIGFRDLYFDANFRQDLAYLGPWSVMDDNSQLAHHIAYHKWEAGWIDQIVSIPPAAPGATEATEVLLVPVEHWDDGLLAAAPAKFGTDPGVKVVQMIQLDLGGDGAVVDLIEARQKGATFSQKLPTDPGIIITNTLQPWDDTRYTFEGKYRREGQLLNPDNILQNAGDSFDLAKAPAFPAKGIVVEVVDRKQIDGIEVFRIKVTRQNTAFIDLYFTSPDPYYMNPDLWVDWAGDNGPQGISSDKPEDHRKYPPGQPIDQGDQVHVPDSGTELHWMVARIRNRGQVDAEDVKFNFQICIPPGGGDKSRNFQSIGTVTVPSVSGGDTPLDVVARWDVPAGFGGHNCILVDIQDYKIPRDSDGAALASDDVWLANNWAQKNVDQFVPVHGSPYEPTEFDFSVNNAGLYPEVAYLEPENLPYGMTLTVTPSRRTIPPLTKVNFRCKLELDEEIINSGCRGDREFKIVVWRVESDTTVKWGGVHYKVRPRQKSATKLTGFWNMDQTIQLNGSVSPDPGGGIAHIRLAFEGLAARWETVLIMPGGAFVLNTKAPAGAAKLEGMALYEGSTLLGPSRAPPLIIMPPTPLR
ncbi:hypothetical protein [Bradyrhizobium sp. BWC-3-1]|uniref:hypothetical protein n=1 Tax=Bradyrhizobium sp. BWC-3-1 TaxID=3080012 RepID=UPI00293EC1DC|nr:hypothetical protein [Bradyrhizobium sp. BWC-3-1]WOH55369.1 hypothetical protein RX329_23995 [Bradyrhizobium sp. BWC-3-1]